jgi:hypothetical protein
MESCTVAGALIPPVGSGVYHGIDTGLSVISVAEVLDPGDHGGVAEAITGGSRRVVLDVEHPGEGNSIARPATAVGEEVVGLSGARAGCRVSKVVAATDEAGSGGTGVVLGKGGINEGSSLRGLCSIVSIMSLGQYGG